MTLVRTFAAVAVTAAALALGACATQENSAPAHAGFDPAKAGPLSPAAPVAAPSGDYPLTTCLVTDEPMGASPVVHHWNGREVRFCCAGCIATFEKDPAKYIGKLDAAKR